MDDRRKGLFAVAALLLVGLLLWWLLRGSATQAPTARVPLPAPSPAPQPPPLRIVNPPRPAPAAQLEPAQSTDGGHVRSTEQGRVLAQLGWGSGNNQLGHERRQEGNPEAPMSLTVDSRGNVLILDQVNHRLVRLRPDGTPESTIGLELRAPQEVAVGRDGTIAVVDRIGDRAVQLLGPDGRPRGRIALEGTNLPEGGGVSGVMLDGNSVWVEREHGPTVRVGDTNGTNDPDRPEQNGRPTRDGRSLLLAGLIDADGGRYYVNSIARETQEHRFTRELRAAMRLLGIVLLDADLQGVIYIAVLGERVFPALPAEDGAAPSPPPPPQHNIVLTCLDGLTGTSLGQALLPANTDPEETFRELTVLDEGGVLFAQRDEHGVTLRRYQCQ